jgi:hypothetical protein
MTPRPPSLFDRETEWNALTRFFADRENAPTLGFLYGRRRQGKTLLASTACAALDGLYFAATEQETALALRSLGESIAAHGDLPAPLALPDWDRAVDALFALGRDRAFTVVLDEFPYLMAKEPSLPSVIQRAFDRAAIDRSSRLRLLLCGSAVSVMEGLRSGSAPLFGRATLDLLLHPFDYRTAAEFWSLSDKPELALRIHAVVGGTPAYHTYARGHVPASLRGFDGWVQAIVLNPAGNLLTEARTLLAEEPTVSDRALYHSILAAIATGRTRTGEIAGTLGRPQTALAHPLQVLQELRLVERQEDAFRARRATFRITEPIIRFFHAVVAPVARNVGLERTVDLWPDAMTASFSSLVLGPHFEELARTWTALHASATTVGGRAGIVAPAQVNDVRGRTAHQLDVVVLRVDGGKQAIAIGEAKWSAGPLGTGELRRLEHIRSLLADRSLADGARTKLLVFGSRGFSPALRREEATRSDVELIDLERLYRGD